MNEERSDVQTSKASSFRRYYGWDFLLGSIAAFYVIMVPYSKVEESFNVQAMHYILYRVHHLDQYDHLEFPGVVPHTFIGVFVVSILVSPIVFTFQILHFPKVYALVPDRIMLGSFILAAVRNFRFQTCCSWLGTICIGSMLFWAVVGENGSCYAIAQDRTPCAQ